MTTTETPRTYAIQRSDDDGQTWYDATMWKVQPTLAEARAALREARKFMPKVMWRVAP